MKANVSVEMVLDGQAGNSIHDNRRKVAFDELSSETHEILFPIFTTRQ